jgi:hypothetical protein
MKNWILSNFNKSIVMLKLVQSFYPHWRKLSLIESMALRRPKTFGTLSKELMRAPSVRRKPRDNSLKDNLIDLLCLMMKTPKDVQLAQEANQ